LAVIDFVLLRSELKLLEIECPIIGDANANWQHTNYTEKKEKDDRQTMMTMKLPMLVCAEKLKN